MLLVSMLCLALPQAPTAQRVEVALTPAVPGEGSALSWSPKGAKVDLTETDGSLQGSFPLGPAGTPPILVRLTRGTGASQYDTLAIDLNRDGKWSDDEVQRCTPKDQRGKWWSSFAATLQVPFASGKDGETRQIPYPMSLWFVFDPNEPEAKPALRWSRRGWHEGKAILDGKEVLVLLTEMQMDGVFTNEDSWALATERKQLLSAGSRSINGHCWLEERAYRVAALQPDGLRLWLEPFDPRTTEAEEKARADTTKADREAVRAAKPLAFGADYAAAMAQAAKSKQRVFVDFATTWCGPCKVMDQWVYTAADVVAAASDIICVKLDGDVERDLVKKFAVAGYPTMLLLDADGKEVRRLVGYQGVAAMVRFFAK
jgi:thiol-disulfide isomerase/thioredoxin